MPLTTSACISYSVPASNEPIFSIPSANQNPVQVSASLGEQSPRFGFYGPLQRNGNLYVLSASPNNSNPALRDQLLVYKSTDNGATWVDISSATKPSGVNWGTQFWDKTTGIVYFCYSVNSAVAALQFIEFDVDAETFGTPYGVGGGPINNGNVIFTLRSNGELCRFDTDATHLRLSICQRGGAWTQVDTVIAALPQAMTVLNPAIDSNGLIHIVFTGGLGQDTFYVNVNSSNVASAFVNFQADLGLLIRVGQPFNPADALLFAGVDGNLYFPVNQASDDVVYILVGAAPLTSPTWTQTILNIPDGQANTNNPFFTDGDGIPTAWFATSFFGDNSNRIFSSQLVGGVWQALATYWDDLVNPPPGGAGGHSAIESMSVGVIGSAPAPTVIPTTIPRGARRTIALTDADFCLYRNYRLYEQIDPLALSCARKPSCFCTDERDWYGENWNEDEEIGKGPPKLAVAFNPFGSVTLPATIDGDVTIFKFIVPYGYDGIILGQFHGYYQTPTLGIIPPNFIQGSGDIQWRISANDRFVKDCGNMLVVLGTLRSQSPIAGGIQLRSGDLVRYIVNVPNLSGTLNPGLGSILAGLHGYYWPRR